MKNSLFLSIIIPVYNVEPYLDQCITSILNCVFTSYEIILVVGKSSDKSNSICHFYATQNSHISVVCQNGTGLSNARNCGFVRAKGTYVQFIDSDDYVNSSNLDKTLQHLYSLRKKHYDVLISDFFLINNEGTAYSCRHQIKETNLIIENYEYLKKFLSAKGNYWNVWRCIYRREFLIKQNITFKENYKSEDIEYSTKIFLLMKSCCFYHNPYYCYRVRRNGSLVNVITMQNVTDLMEILDDSIQMVCKNPLFPYSSIIKNKLVNEFLFSYLLVRDIPKEFKNIVISEIETRLPLIKNTYRGKCFYILTKLFGVNMFSFVLYSIRKSRRFLLKIN